MNTLKKVRPKSNYAPSDRWQHNTCKHCGNRIERFQGPLTTADWFHPNQVTTDCGGSMCKDGVHNAEPKTAVSNG